MNKFQSVAGAMLVLACASVAAQENTLRVGLINLDIHSKSADLSSNGPAFLTPQPAGLNVGNATTLLLAYTRKLNDHFDLDIVMGLPPKHNVYGRGNLEVYGVTAQVKQRAPTAFINYNFFDPTSKFRPFVGLGLNYTQFFDANSTTSGNLATGGPTKIDLTSSWGAAAQVGFSYKFADRWSFVASLATAQVKSDMTATTGSIARKTTIDFRPVVLTAGVGYSF
ncbi:MULTISPECIES: OmpW/AlkL family protein [unclassified Undibacterium]|uniref:OmpW/AlkL family protein n=1 Tax=unclassified Undibacterium TaxID=2630295 RepID=UPI002AC9D310|nr:MULTISPECIES: OmpW family outer membrane protein [unclassified Undibacterium]MEB0139192.1 OmpW family outer membrane protein [Undibacterium sp. CCC2.1]MEB0172233.1 OmpW family outer membrane protein [Undibacterium sp. CCC1.1]MEB0175910.1 OmpW family outer membrane protein [Undibacterium sp. CCC3.4]MEB0215230.1 OmpW family outer membrane protein [Undibacterium sp. 5I2]WPX43528.1 OmpW family outer membrane protein [Undibacterium sp. CCC3.4]